MKFSVIIPAYNESERIEQVIFALRKQTVNRCDYEIILVDNKSTDNTGEVALASGCDKVVNESKQGTNLARQRGVVESKGRILAFLDADCIPPTDWLEKIEYHLSKKGVYAISGPYDYEFEGLTRVAEVLYTNYFFSIVDKLLYFFFRKKAGVMMGGNFAASKETLEKIGGIPPFKFHGDDSAIAMLISRKVGKVLFHRKFNVISSSRRLRDKGILRLTTIYGLYYLINYFSTDDELKEGNVP